MTRLGACLYINHHLHMTTPLLQHPKVTRLSAPPSTNKPPKPTEQKLPITVSLLRWSFQRLGPFVPKRMGTLAWRLFKTPVIRAKHGRSDTLLDTAQRSFLPHQGQQIRLYTWGSGTRTILLVHGWESRGTALRALVPDLLAQGFRVVAMDAPAHGESTGRQVHPLMLAQAIGAVIDHLGNVDSIAAHSFGGFSTAILLQHVRPDLQLRRFVNLAAFSSAEVPFRTYQTFFGFSERVFEEMVRAAQREVGVNPLDFAFLGTEKPASVAQVLIVHDEADPITHFDNARHYFESWADTQLLITQGCGHFRILKAPNIVKFITTFLAS